MLGSAGGAGAPSLADEAGMPVETVLSLTPLLERVQPRLNPEGYFSTKTTGVGLGAFRMASQKGIV